MSKHYERFANFKFIKFILVTAIVVSAIIICSIVGVFANTVPCEVVDGDNVYNLKMINPDKDEIIQEAINNGMEELGENDYVVSENGVLIVKRAIEVSVTTYEETISTIAYVGDCVEDVLVALDFEYEEEDLVSPRVDEILTENTDIEVQYYSAVTVQDYNSVKNTFVYGGTVEDALKMLSVELGEYDTVSPSLDTQINSKTTIEISRGKEIELNFNGEISTVVTYSVLIEDLLEELEVLETEELIINFETYEEIVDGMSVEISSVVYVQTEKEQEIKYTTTYISDSSMEAGESYVKTAGQTGVKTLYYEEKYLGGELVETYYVSTEVTTEAVDEVIVTGTKNATNTFIDADGNTVAYSSVMVGECTAYCEPGGITSLGWDAQVGVVAVNPAVIPYGTKLYITSGSVVYGYAIAGDTGGAALCNDILVDLYYDTVSEAWQFGRRDMTVYILS